MRKIRNIHLNDDPEVYQCFGCSPYNEFGLHLEFWEDGEEVVSFWNPRPILQSYPKILHGGIQSTLLDEIAGWLVYVKCGTVGMTGEMKVRFKKPLMIDEGEITIRANLVEQHKRTAIIQSRLINSSGIVCSEAEFKFFLLSETDAREKYNYPGIDAFFEEE
jgi:acyl-coenzyme A thioesterase PaaI-like protein